MNIIAFIFLLALLFISKNGMVSSKKARWKKLPTLNARLPHEIMYYVDNSSSQAPSIHSYLRNLEKYVCIKFIKQKTEISGIGINYLRTNDDSDIELNKNLKKPTNIYLNDSVSDRSFSRSWHFFTGMALGLIPEITRYDRDNYVEVYTKNITKPYLKYYKKETKKKKYFGNFDYGSVMMPTHSFGGKSNSITYKCKSYPFYDYISGREYSFSTSDLKRLNHMYCENKCNNLHGCRKRGFPLNNCIGCYCNTEYFISPICDVYPANEHISCGTKNLFKSKWKTSYIKHTNVTGSCFYLIKSSNGKNVAVTVKSLILQPQFICHQSGLIIFYRSDWSILPLTLCGNQSNVKIPPLNKEVYIIFDDFKIPNSFSITYRNA